MHLGSVSQQTNAARNSALLSLLNEVQRFVQLVSEGLQISMTDSFLDGLLVDFHSQGDAIIHCYRQRLSTSHLA